MNQTLNHSDRWGSQQRNMIHWSNFTSIIPFQRSKKSAIPKNLKHHQHQYFFPFLNPCGSKPSSSSNSGIQITNLDHIWSHNPLHYYLSNPITGLHLKIHIRVVEQNDADRPSVIRIDHTRSHINGVLPCQPRPRRWKPSDEPEAFYQTFGEQKL